MWAVLLIVVNIVLSRPQHLILGNKTVDSYGFIFLCICKTPSVQIFRNPVIHWPYRIALKFRGSLISLISRIWNDSQNYFNKIFYTSAMHR